MPRAHAIAVALLFTVAVSAESQSIPNTGYGSGGCSVTNGVDCTSLYANVGHGSSRHNWLVALVLIRVDSAADAAAATASRDTSVQRATTKAYREAMNATEDAGRQFIGGVSGARMWSGAYTHHSDSLAGDTLYIGGRTLALPRRDSALVVMFTQSGVPGAAPVFVGTAWIPAKMPAAYWPKDWSHGDTTFFIHPHGQEAMLRAALAKVPAISEFLR
jgi:hypothetical protein